MSPSVSQTPLVLIRRIPFWASLTPSATAWIERAPSPPTHHSLSWLHLASLVWQRTQWTKARTAGQNVPIGIHLPNGLDWLVACFATQSAGAIDVPFDYRLDLDQTLRLANSVGCQALITWQHDQAVWISLDHHQCEREAHLPAIDSNNISLLSARDLSEWDRELASISPSATATLLFTSGTTGEPKAVALGHANLSSNASGKWLAVPQTQKDRRLSVLSFAHAYARTSDLGTWMISGSELSAVNSADELFDWAPIIAPTVMNTVPYLIQRAAERAGNQPINPLLGGRMRWLGCGGAPLAHELFERLRKEGITVIQGYGLTETSPVITSASPDAAIPGCVGKPIPGVEVRIDEHGEVWCRGPNIMQGYWRDHQATRARLANGWFRTGDRGTWHAQGQLQIIGRTDDTITLATGHKVAPAPIERELLMHPQLKQCVVFGDKNGRLSVLYWSEDTTLSDTTLKRDCSAILKAFYWYEQPQHFIRLPRPLTFTNGELTIKGTPRRNVVLAQFASWMNECDDRSRGIMQPDTFEGE